jgi:hypothetical protein
MNFFLGLVSLQVSLLQKTIQEFILPPFWNHLYTFCINLTKTFITKKKLFALT